MLQGEDKEKGPPHGNTGLQILGSRNIKNWLKNKSPHHSISVPQNKQNIKKLNISTTNNTIVKLICRDDVQS